MLNQVIRCHYCQNMLTVSSHGGSFQCPSCGAINMVGTPMPAPALTPAQASLVVRTARKTKENDTKQKTSFVLWSFIGCGVFALFFGWWGILLGTIFLGWSIAGILNKLPGPMNLVFPESPHKFGLATMGLSLGILTIMCGAMSVSQAEETQKALAVEKEASARNKEREEAAAKDHAKTVVVAYGVSLDTVERLLTEGKDIEAAKEMKKAQGLLMEYQGTNAMPAEISALAPFQKTLSLSLEKQRLERRERWIVQAEGVTGNRAKCKNRALVGDLRNQVKDLYPTGTHYEEIQKLAKKLDSCLFSKRSKHTFTKEEKTSQSAVKVCCKRCNKGVPCGDSCISANRTCHKAPGCAC